MYQGGGAAGLHSAPPHSHLIRDRVDLTSSGPWGGIAYRDQDAVIGYFGFRFMQNFMVSYSYDWSITDFSGQQSGTHEIILGYRFDFGEQKCTCPKYSL